MLGSAGDAQRGVAALEVDQHDPAASEAIGVLVSIAVADLASAADSVGVQRVISIADTGSGIQVDILDYIGGNASYLESSSNLYIATCEMYHSTESERVAAYQELLSLPATTTRGQAHAQL